VDRVCASLPPSLCGTRCARLRMAGGRWTATDGLLNALPRARRIVLDQAGHAPWRERPDEVQAATLEALTPR